LTVWRPRTSSRAEKNFIYLEISIESKTLEIPGLSLTLCRIDAFFYKKHAGEKAFPRHHEINLVN